MRFFISSINTNTSIPETEILSYYVSESGSDSNNGLTELTAFATIEKARDAIRLSTVSSGTINVFIDGNIFISNTIEFTTADSGVNDTLQINYKALNSANKPTVSGGYVVPKEDIVDNAGIWEFTLPLAYRSIYDSDNYDLYVNDKRKYRSILSRPTVNVMTVQSYSVDVAPSGDVEASGYAIDFGTKTIGLPSYVIAKLRTYTAAQINSCVFHCIHLYDHWIHNIDSVDPVLDVIYCTGSTWNQDQISVGARCWIENVYETLLDGQFYTEVGTGVYSYKPEVGETIANTEIVIPILNQIFKIEGNSTSDKIENVHFENIKFKYTNVEQDWYYYTPRHTMSTINDAILLNYINNVTFKNIEAEHIGENFINYFRGCTYGNIELSYFYDIGASPIHIGEFTGQLIGDKAISQDTHHNTVTNNIIHHVSISFLDSLGIEIRESSDNTISYNEISGVNNFAISVGAEWSYLDSWNTNNVIHKNHISYINPYIFSDSGALHLLAARTGTIVSNNIIHDVFCYSYNGIGIYPDNGSIGCIVENNLVYNTRTGGYHQNMSKDIIVRNNIFAYSEIRELEISGIDGNPNFFTNNIILGKEGILMTNKWYTYIRNADENLYYFEDSVPFDFDGNTFAAYQLATGNDTNSYIDKVPGTIDEVNRTFIPNTTNTDLINFTMFDTTDVGVYGTTEWKAKAEFPQELIDAYNAKLVTNFIPY